MVILRKVSFKEPGFKIPVVFLSGSQSSVSGFVFANPSVFNFHVYYNFILILLFASNTYPKFAISSKEMLPQKDRLDIINEVLEECILAYPVSSFIISLYKQYQQRGSLSKKQLQGLYGKASKIESLPPGKLATIEAIIKRMPTRYKSELPEPAPLFEKDEPTGRLITEILEKFPNHKRVLFLRAKYDNNEILSPADTTELKRFRSMIK